MTREDQPPAPTGGRPEPLSVFLLLYFLGLLVVVAVLLALPRVLGPG